MKYKEIHFSTIDSTNLYIKQHYKELDDLTIVSSDYQSAGKGRNDRTWLSQSGDNLLFSLLIKKIDIVSKGGYLSLVAAISVAKILEKRCFDGVFIKWPNDVYLHDKKVAGILLEGQIPEYVVIGIGLNVNQEQFLGDYRITPTSLYLQKHEKVNIDSLKEELFANFIDNIINIDLRNKEYIDYFNSHNYLLNKTIEYQKDGQSQKGIVLGINDNFSLIIQKDDGIESINSGEVSIKKVAQ